METENKRDEMDQMDKPLPFSFIFILPFFAGVILALFLFPRLREIGDGLRAGYISITFALNITISYAIINQKNPRVLRNRMKVKKVGLTASTRKSAGSDRFVMPVLGLGFFGALIIPGLEHRFGWPVDTDSTW